MKVYVRICVHVCKGMCARYNINQVKQRSEQVEVDCWQDCGDIFLSSCEK